MITDFYAYDTGVPRNVDPNDMLNQVGQHWVSDLLVECHLEVTKADGAASLDLVKGGKHFRCALDCTTGKATLSIDGVDDFHPTAQTSVKGLGRHHVAFANIDHVLTLWVDGSVVEFDDQGSSAPTTYAPLDNDLPRSTADDPGDLAPAGIGAQGCGLRVSQLRLWRRFITSPRTTAAWSIICRRSPPTSCGSSGRSRPVDEEGRRQSVGGPYSSGVSPRGRSILHAGRQQPRKLGHTHLGRAALCKIGSAGRPGGAHLLAAFVRSPAGHASSDPLLPEFRPHGVHQVESIV